MGSEPLSGAGPQTRAGRPRPAKAGRGPAADQGSAVHAAPNGAAQGELRSP